MSDFGYGTWLVTCPACEQQRSIRGHKYKNGTVRGEEHSCHKCRAKKLTNRTPIVCPTCGDVRLLKKAELNARLSTYCKHCSKMKGMPKRKDGKHVQITSHGYAVVWGLKNHPLKKYGNILEHWLVLYEQHPMGSESVLWFREHKFTIHHKNGKRDDNDFENLELRAPGKHPQGWTIDEMREVIKRYDTILGDR